MQPLSAFRHGVVLRPVPGASQVTGSTITCRAEVVPVLPFACVSQLIQILLGLLITLALETTETKG